MYATQTESQPSTLGCMGLSGVLHIALFIGALMLQAMPQPPKVDVTEIEFITPKNEPLPMIPVAHKPVPAVKAIVRPQKVRVATPKPAPRVVTKAAPVAPAIPAPIEELPIPTLETPDLEVPGSFEEASLSEEDIDSGFETVDQETAREISRLAQEIDSQGSRAIREQESHFQNLKTQNEIDTARIAAESQRRRAGEKAELNRMQAEAKAQRAAALRKAQAEARAQAAAKAAAARKAEAQAAAEARARAASSRASSNQQVPGGTAVASTGSQFGGSDSEEGDLGSKYGIPGGVRSLDQLRQLPGNKRPDYDNDDRYHRREGKVAFLAYVTKEGQPIKFRMVQSSGHRTLDSKTLTAIKNWKFYPGQEGWVEIPFSWDLKGGPKERPTTLRRKVSQN